MTGTRPILGYSPRPSPPRHLTLVDSEGTISVIFGVPPKWVYLAPIVAPVLMGLFQLAMGVSIAAAIWQLARSPVPAPPNATIAKQMQELDIATRHLALRAALYPSLAAFAWWSIAAYQWYMYRRWGRVPRVLSASERGLVLSRLGLWRMRERNWPPSQIKAVELRPLKGNLNWKRTVADLYIHRQRGRRLRFRLSSPNRQLPEQVARQLALTLGCRCEVSTQASGGRA
jgi:hypothetical protein